jgi:prefoldin subunit 5
MNEESVVMRNGITVTKSFSQDDFPVPAVTFEIQSTREDPVDLRITDTIPEGFGVEQIGFHPDYGSEHWTATGDGEVCYERTIEPDTELTTVYGVRMGEGDEPTAFLEKPSVEVDPAEAAEPAETVPEESSSVVRELARGDRETVPGLEDDAPSEASAAADVDEAPGIESTDEPDPEVTDKPDAKVTDESDAEVTDELGADVTDEPEAEPFGDAESESAEPIDTEPIDVESAGFDDEPTEEPAAEPDESGSEEADSEVADSEEAVSPAAAVADAEAVPEDVDAAVTADSTDVAEESGDVERSEEETPPMSNTETESVAAALAAEIEAGEVPEADLSVLRSALGPPEHETVRVEHLQSRVSDLEAYTDALEAFLDENGRAKDLLEGLEADVEALDEDLGSVEERLDQAAEERNRTNEHLENLEDTVEAVAGVAENIERIRGDLEALDERVEGLEETTRDLRSVEEDVEDLESDLEELAAWRDQLSDVF